MPEFDKTHKEEFMRHAMNGNYKAAYYVAHSACYMWREMKDVYEGAMRRALCWEHLYNALRALAMVK